MSSCTTSGIGSGYGYSFGSLTGGNRNAETAIAGKEKPDAPNNNFGGGNDLGTTDLSSDLGGEFLEENDLTAESPTPEVEETPPSDVGGDMGE